MTLSPVAGYALQFLQHNRVYLLDQKCNFLQMYASTEAIRCVIDRNFILIQGPIQKFLLLCSRIQFTFLLRGIFPLDNNNRFYIAPNCCKTQNRCWRFGGHVPFICLGYASVDESAFNIVAWRNDPFLLISMSRDIPIP